MGRTLGVSELHLVRRVRRAHREWEAGLQELSLLVPVDGRVELDSLRAGIETHHLRRVAVLAEHPFEGDLRAELRLRHHAPGLGGWAVAARLEVERVDVPGVEADRAVVVELEPVAGGRERLATRGLVHDARHRPVLGELDAQVPVLECQAVDHHLVLGRHDLAGAEGGSGDDHQLARGRLRHLPPRLAECVQGRAPALPEPVRAGLHLCEVALCVLVDQPDRRAGEDVVKLLKQQQLPEAIELRARIVFAGRGQHELRVVQRYLRARLPRFVRPASCRCRGGTRDTAPRRRSGARGLPRRAGRRTPGGCDLGAREALQVASATQRLEHRACRPAAAVAVPEDQHAPCGVRRDP